MNKITISFLLLAVVQACTYAISPDITSKADKALTFQRLQADPEAYKGKTVILGGVIAQTGNTKQGALIEIIERPLDYWGKPENTNQSGGRFLVQHSGALDEAIYAPGRQITVAGVVEGARDSSNSGPSYILIRSKQLKLWERNKQSWDRPQWMDPLYDPNGPPRRDW